ncbi:1-acylglycerol-3-phosphate O-acyltransferase PNPLA3 [Galemys pyrenaicus]|uniref:triacylglycerol lipase n=1 Tax=Galemys pyrenaicus TaxID=202257 RepID=A0A8J6AA49_GALPY|nr:1-acylglycerol-3-phosphate O-acyltransferase PNPLA3 [Galemys pyrenaicus]
MFDSERGWSICYVGCGFLGSYYVGVTHCLMERAPHILRDARMTFGVSGGALHCHCLRRCLPDDIHLRISGKACLSLTRVDDFKNVLVSEFHSKEEVVDALMCTCFIPFYCGFIPPSFRGVRYIDGGLTNNAPCIDSKTTLMVSPFYGESDICPKSMSTNFQIIDFINLSLQVCSENIYLTIRALVPPSTKVCTELCFRGYLDTVRFLEENGVCDRPQPSLSAPCGELASQGVLAAPEVKLEDDLLDHLRLSIRQWEERFLQILSPKLILALRETAKDPDGYLSKVCNLLLVKVLCYALLPCTLPVEMVVHAVHR